MPSGTMGSTQYHRTVELKTIDGVRLEAWLFEVPGPAPAIVMTHGAAGYNVLLYDTRGVGGSGGSPRNQVDPLQQSEDVSDVVTYAMSLRSVDPSCIFLWGMSIGGTISAVAAAIDRRVAGVVMVCPIFSMVRPDKRATAFAQLIRDRQSQLRGNAPLILPPFNSKGENPIGYAGSGGPGGREGHYLMKKAAESGHPTFSDRITLQSYHKMALFRPREILAEMLEDVPTLMVIPELDNISPASEQKAVYETLKTPKSLYLAKGKGHMDILTGDGSENVCAAMMGFMDSVLDSSMGYVKSG